MTIFLKIFLVFILTKQDQLTAKTILCKKFLQILEEKVEEAIPKFVQAGVETLDTGAEAVKTQTLLGRVSPGVCVPVSSMSLMGLSGRSAFTCRSAQGAARMLLLLEKMMWCCAAGTIGCLDFWRRASVLVGQVNADGADVQALCHGLLGTVWLHCDEAQQVGGPRGLKGFPLV